MSFSIITWNVWFDLHHVIERINSQINEILLYKPSVVCLQEITDTILSIIKNHKELNNNYVVVSDEHSTKPYGEIMLLNRNLESKYKYYSIPFPNTKMSRRISVLHLNRYNICVINTHLESEFNRVNKGDNKIRQEQAKYLFKYAKYILSKDNTEYVILAGDMNVTVDDEGWMNNLMQQYNVKDTLNRKDVYTYDYTKNSNIVGKFRSRLDRILTLSNNNIKPTFCTLLGTKPFKVNNSEECFPSDHFGIFLNLTTHN